METEQFDAIVQYFQDYNIRLPESVKNSLQDVFEENEKVDKVLLYHKEDREDFENDLSLVNEVSMYIDGRNEGTTNNVWTYYGSVDFSLLEKINLFDSEGNVIEEISDFQKGERTMIIDPNEWAVILHEIVEWNTSESNEENRKLELVIFCPHPAETDEPQKNKEDELFERVKAEDENYIRIQESEGGYEPEL